MLLIWRLAAHFRIWDVDRWLKDMPIHTLATWVQYAKKGEPINGLQMEVEEILQPTTQAQFDSFLTSHQIQ